MNQLFLGSIGCGITGNIKTMIRTLDQRVIVLDFNNEYDDIQGHTIFLDKVNPTLGEIDIHDVKAMNAGYLARSRCLFNISDEILKEGGFERKENLIDEAVERLQNSWSNTENMYGKMLNQKMPIKKNRAHVSIDRLIEEILQHEVVILRAKNMHSDHLRGVAFALLSRLSRTVDEQICIVCDELISFYSQGNTKMFFETLDFGRLDFVFSYNKATTIPAEIFPIIDNYHLYRITSPAELKFIKELGLRPKKDLRKLENDSSLLIEKQQLALSL